jgi:eukaryotic-like serine/threonine-protein kinase
MDPQQGPPQPDLLIGQTIGNYLVTQKLGEGGMGSVYLAEHPSIGKKVALKVLHSEFSSNQEVAARFFNEAKAVNDIGHPNIVDIVDFGIIQAGLGREQLVYFIMEYLAGQTLSALIRSEAPLPPERALGIGLQVADALGASHKCGIVHRDLKPDNIILLRRGRENDFVKLLDFGIAKLTSDAPGSRRTRTGIVMGTPAYMSPEQCEGRGNIDHRTDVYALGIVLYEMLTGRVPFIGEGYGEILVQHLTQPPVPLSQYRMMNAHVEAVVMKALEKRADMRFPTMDEMMRAMADPVGYVESHGGVVGFAQRQIMPSNAPLPSVRLTPPPLSTPVPGSAIPTPWGLPQKPTTIGGASGEVAPSGAKKGVLVLSGIVVVAAAIAIAVVVSRKDKTVGPGGGSGDGSGSVIAMQVEDAGPPPEVVIDAPPPVAPTIVVDAAPPVEVVDADSGSAAVTVPKIEDATITLSTSPSRARILVEGVELSVRTPTPFKLPKKAGKKVHIVLRLAGYEDFVVPAFVVSENVSNDYKLAKRRPPPPPPGRGSGSAKPPGTGSGSNDLGLMKPE